MALNDITLTQGMRSNLISLQSTVSLLNRTQERLSSGKKVNNALDNPINFFAAQSHLQRASDLAARKDGMSEGIQVVKAADAGIKAITTLIESAKGLASAARTAGSTQASVLATQFNTVLDQIDALAVDSGYKGVNLLAADTLTIDFNENATNSLAIAGFDASTSTSGLNIATATNAWVANTDIDDAVEDLDAALTSLRGSTSTLSSNLAIVNARQEFTTNMVNTLTGGADNLTLADMNEEGANMLMLQTRQALSTTALSMSAQAAQSVLRLF